MRYICTSIVAIASFCITGSSLADFWPTQIKGEASSDHFGFSIVIDGDTCVIGATGTNSNTGSAYVYTSDASGNWSQIAELNASDGAINDQFGGSIAIDGDTCVIGATGTNSNTGSAYVFTSDASGNWSQAAKLNGVASLDFFGKCVAIDGDTCMIGAIGTNSYTGSIFVYTSDASGNWNQVAELNGAAINDQFGSSIAIDGDTRVIGAAKTNSGTGSAYIYTSDASGNWSQVAELNASDGAINDEFGDHVAIDGGSCVIGASGTNSGTGGAYVYTSDASGNWNQVAEFNGQVSSDYFGVSVAIDGDTCVIGASGTNSGTGGAYIYTSDEKGNWSQVAEIYGQASSDYYGVSVAIDGDTCMVGAIGTDSSTGSAYVYGGNSATGACCVNSGCDSLTEASCTSLGGTWLGEGGSCDDCPASCTGDTDGNGVVNIEDLLDVISIWGACP